MPNVRKQDVILDAEKKLIAEDPAYQLLPSADVASTNTSGHNPNSRKAGNKNLIPNRNPGGVTQESKKSVKRALHKLLLEAPEVVTAPATKADQIALWLWETARDYKGTRTGLAALRELFDRADGRSAKSESETQAIAASGTKILIIDSSLRPTPKAKQIEAPFTDAEVV